MDPGSNTNIDDMLSTIFSLFPSEPADPTMLDENPSRPSEFAKAMWHMLEDNAIMGSEFDFSLPPLMPTIDHSATTPSQTTFHNQLFPMDSATGLGALAPHWQAIDNANFFNFSPVGHEKTSKDKRTMGVWASGILYVLF